MAKKSKIKIVSVQYQNEDGDMHLATINKANAATTGDNSPAAVPPSGACTCGSEMCVNGVKYRCMPDPFGDCVWFKTTESC
jgi:hypothetical protein